MYCPERPPGLSVVRLEQITGSFVLITHGAPLTFGAQDVEESIFVRVGDLDFVPDPPPKGFIAQALGLEVGREDDQAGKRYFDRLATQELVMVDSVFHRD